MPNQSENRTFTAEELAIRQWLSKPYPASNPCACMGPQALPVFSPTIVDGEIVGGALVDRFDDDTPYDVIDITDLGKHPVKVGIILRKYKNFSMQEIAEILKKNSVKLSFAFDAPSQFAQTLELLGVTFECSRISPAREPFAPAL